MNKLWADYVELLRRKVTPALGCTEPLSVALASAQCRSLLGRLPETIDVVVSPNLYKNGMGVGVPGTGMVGLRVAAAIGALAGEPDAGLEVLKSVEPRHAEPARALAQSVAVRTRDVPDSIYAEVTASAGEDVARVVIAGWHTRVTLRELNGRRLYRNEETGSRGAGKGRETPPMTLAGLVDFAGHVPLADIAFMGEAVRLNTALAEEGLSRDYGLRIGATLAAQMRAGLLADDLMTRAMSLSAAASDARMDGAMLPAMSNSGSGNQGIAATMPVVAAARVLGASEERLTRAVALSHLVAIYIKSRQNPLSALCAASTAGMGAGAAITWLLGGDAEAVARCVQNMIGDVSGVICDGAKTGCAMKVSTAAATATKAALLAMSDVRVTAAEGIVAESADASIDNLGKLSREGMLETDRQIIAIMMAKESAATRLDETRGLTLRDGARSGGSMS